MLIYRIVKEEYSKELKASGNAARWNKKGTYAIYTAESKSLACLENLVHRSGEGNNALYKVMVIKVPDNLKIESIDPINLKKGWQKIEHYNYCQNIGTTWLLSFKTAVLKVPSAIIKNEFNYMLNPNCNDFKKIKLVGVEDFIFDSRF
jgi:RES domain-containing protein